MCGAGYAAQSGVRHKAAGSGCAWRLWQRGGVTARARGRSTGGGTLVPGQWRQQWALGLCVRRTARRELWRMPEVQGMRAEATKCSGRVGEWEVQRSLPCARVGRWGGMRCCALLVPGTQHGAGCGVQFVRSEERDGARVAGAGCDGAESAADAVSAAPPWCSVAVGRGHGQRTRGDRHCRQQGGGCG